MNKAERLKIFLNELRSASSANSEESAFRLISATLNDVEDTHFGVPFNPETWESDGRMYPPQEDNARPVEGPKKITRYRSKLHNTFVSENGAIEIQAVGGKVLFSKPGSDGKSVFD